MKKFEEASNLIKQAQAIRQKVYGLERSNDRVQLMYEI